MKSKSWIDFCHRDELAYEFNVSKEICNLFEYKIVAIMETDSDQATTNHVVYDNSDLFKLPELRDAVRYEMGVI